MSVQINDTLILTASLNLIYHQEAQAAAVSLPQGHQAPDHLDMPISELFVKQLSDKSAWLLTLRAFLTKKLDY